MMTSHKREISKEIFDRANNGYLTSEDYDSVFSISERWGYGVYGAKAHEENGKYYVEFSMGSSCE